VNRFAGFPSVSTTGKALGFVKPNRAVKLPPPLSATQASAGTTAGHAGEASVAVAVSPVSVHVSDPVTLATARTPSRRPLAKTFGCFRLSGSGAKAFCGPTGA
jgi:hypothetical protein